MEQSCCFLFPKLPSATQTTRDYLKVSGIALKLLQRSHNSSYKPVLLAASFPKIHFGVFTLVVAAESLVG